MVNIEIHLNKKHNPKELIKYLLHEKLISSASIDDSNISYSLDGEQFSETDNYVITAQSKSLLFNKLVEAVENKIGEETPIWSTPIVGINKVLDDAIRTHTLPI